MPVVAEAVPDVLHVSLFLFFVGLCDSVPHIDTTVGISTAIPIGTGGLLYVCTIIGDIPAINISEFVLRSYLVCGPETTQAEIQIPRTRWRVEICG